MAKQYIYPAETTRHLATILGFPSQPSLPPQYYHNACREIIDLAAAIADFEPVCLYARPENVPRAESLVAQHPAINLRHLRIIPLATNHLWVRDTGPVYVHSTHQRVAINFGFNEWGGKFTSTGNAAPDNLAWPVMTSSQIIENATFAQRVIDDEPSTTASGRVTLINSKIRLEGGALVSDGDGTLLATESSIVNANRNPGLGKCDIECELRRLLGVDKIIWFPGRRDLDVTDVHADAEVAFIRPGVVVLSRPNHSTAAREWMDVYHEIKEILHSETDAKGRRFAVHEIEEPDARWVVGDAEEEKYEDEPATNYVNFYFVNGGVIVPGFGDAEKDAKALETMQALCPERQVRQVYVKALPLTGGVVHCATQPVVDIDVDVVDC